MQRIGLLTALISGISFSPHLQTSAMRSWVIYGSILLFSCGTAPESPGSVASRRGDTGTASVPVVMPPDTDINFARDTTIRKPQPAPVKNPSGIYQFLMPWDNGQKVLHTVSFYPGTFRMQEEYNGDSVIVVEGTWAPSRDFIWLYKDQLVRGRYTWKGDTLQYFSPRLNKKFSMYKLTPAVTNKVWQDKKKEGQRLYGIGTEPFWSVEITRNDSLVVNMPDWNASLRAKITEARSSADSAVFSASKDSLRLVVFPYFCSDGMSDFLYSQRLVLEYKGQTYQGCGEFLQAAY